MASSSESRSSRGVKQLLCGGLAGCAARTTTAPIDRTKILLQTQHLSMPAGAAPKYTGIVQTLSTVVKEEGPLALFRGNLVNCIRVFPYSGCQFVFFDLFKGAISQLGGNDATQAKLNVPQRLTASACAQVVATTVTHPLDLLRLRLAVYRELGGSIPKAAASVWSEGGVVAFYKGLFPTIVSVAPFGAINFTCYDTIKGHVQPTSSLSVGACGAASAMIATSICYPLDVVRRRMQLKGTTYKSTMDASSTIVREEGVLGLYKGQLANLLKTVPNNAVRFIAFEFLKKLVKMEKRHTD